MKVYELINILMKCDAGADVLIIDTEDIVTEGVHIGSLSFSKEEGVNIFTKIKE